MIEVDAAKCSGCSRCEVNCAFFHSGSVGRSTARIKLVKVESLGIDYPVACRHCEERYCHRCPENAIEIGPQGQIIVSPTLCNGCSICERLCPVGAIELYNEIPYVCDLCGGAPRCVDQCPMAAIAYSPSSSGSISLKSFRKASRGMDPEAKRLNYAMQVTEDLRAAWAAKRRA